MLADKKRFDILEKELTKKGTIDRFEKNGGKILGRMMITPDELFDGIGHEHEDDVHVLSAHLISTIRLSE